MSESRNLNLSYDGKGRTWKDVAVVIFLIAVLGAFAVQVARTPSRQASPPPMAAAAAECGARC